MSKDGRAAIQSYRNARRIIQFPVSKEETLRKILKRYFMQKTLVFTPSSETAYIISRKFLIMPITSEIGKKEREQALTYFREGKINSLVSCRVLNEGMDIPQAEIAIIIGGTHGEREHIQRIGRVLRKNNNKIAIIFELICEETMEMKQWKKRNQSMLLSATTP